MKRVLFLTTIPSPYRVDFFNALARHCDLEVVFEARRDPACRFNLYDEAELHFHHRFLSDDKDFRCLQLRGIWAGLTARCDCLVIHSYHSRTQTCLLLLLKLLRRPYWFETDGGMVNPHEPWLKRQFKRLLIGGAQGYLSPSQGTDEYLAYYRALPSRIHRYSFTSIRRAEVLPETVTAGRRLECRRRLGIPDAAPVILSVGQFIPRKGFDILARAMARLCQQGEQDDCPHAYIVGGEPTPEFVRLRLELHLEPTLHFVGYCSKSQLSLYYQAADLFVLPTREDIWGLVINEAMAHGLPVVTTQRCLAGREMLDRQELTLVPVEDVEALADSIRKLLADPSMRQALSQRNLTYAQQHSIEQMALDHVAALALEP